jgi:hypothetical protein
MERGLVVNRFKKRIHVAKKNPFKVMLVALCIVLFVVIQIWKDTAPLGVSDWNGNAVSTIKTTNPDDFSFAVFGDNKDGYALFDSLLKDIDGRGEASFAIAMGDLVPSGRRGNFRGFIGELKDDLKIPLVTVVGNHDLQHGSSEKYRETFGDTNYRFSIGRNEFIVLDASTDSGLDQAQRQWVEAALEKSQDADTRFVFMHIPPFDPRGERFHKCLKNGADLVDLFQRYHVTHLFAAHIHGYFSGVWKGVPYTVTGGGGGGLQAKEDEKHFFHHYLVAHVHHGKANIKVIPVSVDIPTRAFDFIEDHLMEWGLLIPGTVALFLLLQNLMLSRKTGHNI